MCVRDLLDLPPLFITSLTVFPLKRWREEAMKSWFNASQCLSHSLSPSIPSALNLSHPFLLCLVFTLRCNSMGEWKWESWLVEWTIIMIIIIISPILLYFFAIPWSEIGSEHKWLWGRKNESKDVIKAMKDFFMLWCFSLQFLFSFLDRLYKLHLGMVWTFSGQCVWKNFKSRHDGLQKIFEI